ncbi:MAG: biopolymer transporter ExbD [Xanthomonadales bacterium]|nr:biopolymer transporter ExbD [Xanthomonadales bacterium]NIN58615.1 biopolymer transporter ExbD [Xanthomonadales bacterium]NIN73904.1 biopolymer transporter ExbD [Xanthomonadales bacterium]NIO12373.1 biopolymer transporter ExbD [Xanthomonadales bacterium]NIP11008.1 biopolymer transporter ExbD [Xanthomonadales bacterium]
MKQFFQQTQAEEESEINITPMLDVVFIMLIFFIVTASFVKEAGIDVNRPDAATAVKQEKANILIAIGPNNDIWIDRRQVDIRSVRPNIERLHAENPQGSVVIQADKESKTDTLVQVMDAARLAGVFNVSIAAQEQ